MGWVGGSIGNTQWSGGRSNEVGGWTVDRTTISKNLEPMRLILHLDCLALHTANDLITAKRKEKTCRAEVGLKMVGSFRVLAWVVCALFFCSSLPMLSILWWLAV